MQLNEYNSEIEWTASNLVVFQKSTFHTRYSKVLLLLLKKVLCSNTNSFWHFFYTFCKKFVTFSNKVPLLLDKVLLVLLKNVPLMVLLVIKNWMNTILIVFYFFCYLFHGCKKFVTFSNKVPFILNILKYFWYF